ncbi:MAG: YHYH protein [Bacteroidota bacterium]
MKYLLFSFCALMGTMFLISSCNKDDETLCTETTWYQDADGDGLGNPDVSFDSCEQPTGYVDNADDDDDVCSGIVDACGVCDGPGETTWYEDADGDGLGNPDVNQDACDQPTGYVENSDDADDTVAGTVYLIDQSYFNSASLISFQTITAPLEDGTTAECFQITFSSNPVESGPFCPTTIDDVAGMGFYDGATNPGLRVFAEALLNDIEADGYDMVNDDGTVNVDNFTGGMPDPSKSYCLEAAPNDNLQLTFIIPAEPKLATSNNEITEIELVGLSLDGVPVNGNPPSAINGPMMGGGGPPGGSDEINFPSVDPCGGHHDPAGYYHWHLVPEVANQVLEANGITEISCTNIAQTTDTHLFGFAKDGYPIYAYADEPTDVDECGGRTAATADYPNGVYHYVASTTVAPNIPKCLKGVAATNAFSYQ